MMSMKSLCLLLSLFALSSAFAPARMTKRASGALSAAKPAKPKYNAKAQTWTPAPGDDGKYPYDAFGALLRHGPAPFISRVTNPVEYEQGILKYMANGGVSRAEATGNMDAMINNRPDWMLQKMAEKKGAAVVDYTELKKKDAALVLIWAFGITPLGISVIQKTVSQF
jgi:hypothetical protein